MIINRLKRQVREIERNHLIAKRKKLLDSMNLLFRSASHSDNERMIIVSITSYPARFKSVCYSVKSMMVQTMKPDRIVLYLDDTCSMRDLPVELQSLQQYGLEIEFRPVNMKPHKKYYYAIKENPEAFVITVDDDIIYPENLIEELVNTEKKFPGCVITSRAHRVTFDESGKIKSYNDWEWESSEEYIPSMSLCATGAGGVLYPPHCMDEMVFDKDLFLKLTPNNDDLWLKFIQIKSGTKVVVCDQNIRRDRLPMPENAKGSLNSSNVHKNMNDEYVNNLIEYFKYSKKDFGYN